MNKCDICEVEWDPRSQEHRRGIDCAHSLKTQITAIYVTVKKLESIFASFTKTEHEKEDATVHAFEQQRNDLLDLGTRFDNLAKRVNLLEHPKMERIRSMPKTGKE